MKKKLICAFLLLISGVSVAQNLSGDWGGTLNIKGTELRVVFHVVQEGKKYTSTMDSPDQGAFGIKMDETTVDGNRLTIAMPSAMINYTGELNDDQMLIGTFSQAGQQFPLNLTRGEGKAAAINRPQEPKAPFPYYQKEVKIENKEAGITLSGTLTVPKKKGSYPVVVLISGSGPQDRDESLMGHKPFLVLADFLTRNGIGVLRYDDRGVGKSEGDFGSATTFDLATDARAAVEFLKSCKHADKTKIGLMGHSEGGIIAPIVAAGKNDIAFVILLAGTGIRGSEILLMQQELIGRANGVSEEELKETATTNREALNIVLTEKDSVTMVNRLKEYISQEYDALPEDEKTVTKDEMIAEITGMLNNPWIREFIRFDPASTLAQVKCPLLAVNGSKDLQVPARVNLEAIERSVKSGGNDRVTVKEFEGLNHLFQECTTGSPNEYALIEQTFSPVAMEYVLNWLRQQISAH